MNILSTSRQILKKNSKILFKSTKNRSYYSPENELKASIRSAQAVEIFRSSFYKQSNSDVQISLTDLDQIITSERVRPSYLVNCYATFGNITGKVSRFLPQETAKVLHQIVDDATTQQLNDSIRNLQANNIDVKETLKYHRDIHTTEESRSDNNNSSTNTKTDTSSMSSKLLESKNLLSTGLYQILKFSESI